MKNFTPHTNPETGREYPFASITLTVGCNVGTTPTWKPEQVLETAREYLQGEFSPVSHTVSMGEWDGIPEISVALKIQSVHRDDMSQLEKQVRALAEALEQEAIGVWDVYGRSALIWAGNAEEARKTA